MILASSSSAVSLALILAAAGFLAYTVAKQSKPTGTRYKVGDEVRWLTTLQDGRVIQVREDDMLYVVEFDNGEIRVLHEERLCTPYSI